MLRKVKTTLTEANVSSNRQPQKLKMKIIIPATSGLLYIALDQFNGGHLSWKKFDWNFLSNMSKG